MIYLYIFLLVASSFLLYWSGSRMVKALMAVAKFLGWKEFVVAFFIMAIAGSAPNLFVGINAAIHGIPELSFGDIVGGNIIDLTLGVGLAILIGRKSLPARGKMVQNSAIFTVIIAILPLALAFDGNISRVDGGILLFTFFFYLYWIFSKEDRFKKIYNNKNQQKLKERGLKGFFRNSIQVVTTLVVLLIASEGIVRGASGLAVSLHISIPIIGIFVVGLANAMPEIYFAIASAKRGRSEMVLGDLMGAVIACATFVLGVVALISPIYIDDFSPFAIGRIFLIISALFFFIAVKTDKKITKGEGVFLLFVYVAFVLSELYLRNFISFS